MKLQLQMCLHHPIKVKKTNKWIWLFYLYYTYGHWNLSFILYYMIWDSLLFRQSFLNYPKSVKTIPTTMWWLYSYGVWMAKTNWPAKIKDTQLLFRENTTTVAHLGRRRDLVLVNTSLEVGPKAGICRAMSCWGTMSSRKGISRRRQRSLSCHLVWDLAFLLVGMEESRVEQV